MTQLMLLSQISQVDIRFTSIVTTANYYQKTLTRLGFKSAYDKWHSEKTSNTDD